MKNETESIEGSYLRLQGASGRRGSKSLKVLSVELAWGLFTRGLGLVYLVFFASLALQVQGLSRIFPVRSFLDRVEADIPGMERFFRFPTLCWLWPERLREMTLVGCGASLLVLVGGPWTPFCLFLAWLLALSLVTVLADFVVFTWDLLLLEAGFLALFLPAPRVLPELGSEPPAPVLALALTFLVARMVLGMGKCKFLGDWTQQLLFIKWFYSFQPLPTRAAWYLAKLPDWVHRTSLVVMFVLEVPGPLLLFLGGPMSQTAALALIALQFAIAFSGNFGIFNLLTAVLCVPALSGAHLVWTGLFANPALWVVALLVMVGGVVYFPQTAWTSNSWLYMKGSRGQPLTSFYRLLHPFHLVNGYGVFDVQETPAADLPDLAHRAVVVIEGSRDGKDWREYDYRYHTCRLDRPPPFFAPHHPRVDHNLYYEAWDMRMASINMQNPYSLYTFTWLDRLIQRLLAGDRAVLALLGHNPFPEGPPRYIRVRRYAYRFSTWQERAETGNWYVRHELANHMEPVGPLPEVFQWPRPEQFRDHLYWWRTRFGLACDPAWDAYRPEEVIDFKIPERFNRGGRHFIYTENVWMDALFQRDRPIVSVRYGGRAYSRLLRLYPGLKKFARFPEPILVAWGEGAVLFSMGGESSVAARFIQAQLGDSQDGWPAES